MPPNIRLNLIRKLPRLESSNTTINSSALQLKRKQFLGLKRRKMIDNNAQFNEILIKKMPSNPQKVNGNGGYLVPKTMELKIDALTHKR